MHELDEELAEYINHLYQEGDSVSVAGWTISGLKRAPAANHTSSPRSSTFEIGNVFTCQKDQTP